jgi:hypothetical protein
MNTINIITKKGALFSILHYYHKIIMQIQVSRTPHLKLKLLRLGLPKYRRPSGWYWTDSCSSRLLVIILYCLFSAENFRSTDLCSKQQQGDSSAYCQHTHDGTTSVMLMEDVGVPVVAAIM